MYCIKLNCIKTHDNLLPLKGVIGSIPNEVGIFTFEFLGIPKNRIPKGKYVPTHIFSKQFNGLQPKHSHEEDVPSSGTFKGWMIWALYWIVINNLKFFFVTGCPEIRTYILYIYYTWLEIFLFSMSFMSTHRRIV